MMLNHEDWCWGEGRGKQIKTNVPMCRDLNKLKKRQQCYLYSASRLIRANWDLVFREKLYFLFLFWKSAASPWAFTLSALIWKLPSGRLAFILNTFCDGSRSHSLESFAVWERKKNQCCSAFFFSSVTLKPRKWWPFRVTQKSLELCSNRLRNFKKKKRKTFGILKRVIHTPAREAGWQMFIAGANNAERIGPVSIGGVGVPQSSEQQQKSCLSRRFFHTEHTHAHRHFCP